ncbi:unnamed protein product [Brugia pahangi]|uniref:Uncharacterized protein n=1 Tax=Brugia pahangi TaxID=6280 RepID=A0A0N4T6L2_BRUPA|nr:unnamed protein product [Brugia pahangi]
MEEEKDIELSFGWNCMKFRWRKLNNFFSVAGDVSPCSASWRYRCYCTGHHDGCPFDWQIDQQANSRKERTSR